MSIKAIIGPKKGFVLQKTDDTLNKAWGIESPELFLWKKAVMYHPFHRIFTWWLALEAFGMIFIPKVWADTIWIEAATAIYYETQNYAGGKLKATLVDNLNHPISEKTLKISLQSSKNTQKFERTVQTNERGEIQIDLALPVGLWQGTIQFEGTEAYQASHAFVTLDIQKCRHEIVLSLDMPESRSELEPLLPKPAHVFESLKPKTSDISTNLWPVDEPLRLTLKRQSGVCRAYEANIQITWDNKSQSIVMPPNVSSVSVPLTTEKRTPGLYVIEAKHVENTFFEAESASLNTYLYQDLFESHIDMNVHWRGIYISATLKPNLPHFAYPIQLTLKDGDKAHVFQTLPNDEGNVVLGPIQGISGCYESSLTRADRWFEHGKYDFEWCFPAKDSNWGKRVALYAGLMGLVGIGLGIGVVRRRRRLHRLPLSPKKWALSGKSNISKVDGWPENVSLPMPCAEEQADIELICIDAQTGAWIPDAICHGMASTSWPMKVKSGTRLQMVHPDYMPWEGLIKGKGQYTISLTTKRNYMISCFESVCAVIYGHAVMWGEISPKNLLADIQKEGLRPDLMQKFERFCQLIAEAAFDIQPIEDEKIDEIYSLSVVCSKKYRSRK